MSFPMTQGRCGRSGISRVEESVGLDEKWDRIPENVSGCDVGNRRGLNGI
jgi:hypothetical protein